MLFQSDPAGYACQGIRGDQTKVVLRLLPTGIHPQGSASRHVSEVLPILMETKCKNDMIDDSRTSSLASALITQDSNSIEHLRSLKWFSSHGRPGH